MKHKIQYILFALMTLGLGSTWAQDDLLAELSDDMENDAYELPAFKAMKICNLQSTKLADKGDIYMYVSHRFGSLKDGASTFFGLDNANTKIQMIYGLHERLQIGLSRESLRKTYAGSAKISLIKQGKKSPVNLAAYGTININTQLDKDRYPKMKYADRLSYASQLLISRRFSKRLSLELAPTYIRQNLVLEPFQKHDQFAIGVGGRVKVSNRLAINADYVYNASRADRSAYKDALSIGLDIETGGHVFQLLFSNGQSTNEPGFITNAEGDWGDGEVYFGFNIVRVF